MKKQFSRREMLRMMGMAMSASVLAACAPAATAVPPTATQPEATAVPPTTAPPTAVPPTATAVPPTPTPAPTAMASMEFSWMIPTQQKTTVGDSVVIKAIEKQFAVQFDFTESPPDDTYTEKKKLAIAAQSIPDLLTWISEQEANEYGPQGAFLDIAPLLSQLPHLKALLDADPIGKYNAYTTDGKLWRIPDYNVVTNPIFDFSYIKDEFDGVGVTDLTTWDNVYDALKKLKTKYPNSYPFAFRGKDLSGSIYMRIMFEMSFTLGKNGAWVGNTDNNIAFDYDAKNYIVGPSAPGYSDAFAFMNKLYSEGLLDPEYLTTDMNGLIQRFKDKKAFFTCDFMGGLSGIAAVNGQLNNGLYPLPTPMVAGKTQVLGWSAGKIGVRGTALSSNLKGEKLTRILQIMDYLYSPDFYNLLYWNPDVAAKDSNGNWYYTNDKMYSKDQATMDKYLPWSINASFQVNYNTNTKPGTPYADYVLNVLTAASNQSKYVPSPVLPFTQDQTATLNGIQTKTDNVYLSKVDQYIMGKTPMTQWDSLISSIKSAGDDQAVDIYNTVYKKYFGS